MASGLAFLAAIIVGNSAVPADVPKDTPAFDEPEVTENSFETVQRQVRVERRVIVRITPFSARRTASELSVPQAAPVPRKSAASTNSDGRCVALNEVAGVQLGKDRRLLLYMRDRRVFSASFERSCPVQGFYSGFYVERPADGMLCAGREKLHARSGADCTLGGFTELKEAASDED